MEPVQTTIDVDGLEQYVSSDVYKKVLQFFGDSRWQYEYKKCSKVEVFDLSKHVAVMVLMQTGKRGGVLCGMQIQQVEAGELFDENDERAVAKDAVKALISVSCEHL